MHALGSNRLSARDRELAPRFYYKRSNSVTCVQKIKNALRSFLSFMFTQVGVIVLIGVYMIIGAFIFKEIEADSQLEIALTVYKTRLNCTKSLWLLTDEYNVLQPRKWRQEVSDIIFSYQKEIVELVKQGYTGSEPGVPVWTFSSSLMYSLTVFTTIGYGNLTPKTSLGKITTILYALLGMPLFLIYTVNIGAILASSFKYIYSKFCRCEKKPVDLPKKATLPSMRFDDAQSIIEDEIPSRRSSRISSVRSKDNNSEAGSVKTKLKKILSHNKKSDMEYSELEKQETGQINHANEKEEIKQSNRLLDRLTSRSSTKSDKEEKDEKQRKKEEKAKKKEEEKRLKEEEKRRKEEVVEFKLVEDIRLVTIPVTTCLMVILFYIGFGAVLFSSWEGWNLMDGTYFCFISLSTIGFGDFVPGNSYIYNRAEDMDESEANAKLVLGTIYILLGLGLISMCINLMQEKIISQVRSMARSIGLIREYRHFDDADGEGGY